MNPIPNEQRKAGFGGVNRYKALEGFDNSEMIIDVTKNMDILSKQLYVQSKSLDEIVKLAENKEKLLAAIPAIQPVKNEDLSRMASGFGWRSDPFTKANKRHMGMDFSAPKGTPVFVSGDGVIERADQSAAGYGKHIRVNHGFGYVSLYAHLSNYNIKKGQRVKRGDLIGFVGNTGRSQAPHLHYEIIKNGVKINPINFYYTNSKLFIYEHLHFLMKSVHNVNITQDTIYTISIMDKDFNTINLSNENYIVFNDDFRYVIVKQLGKSGT